jgi:hypothetical protein
VQQQESAKMRQTRHAANNLATCSCGGRGEFWGFFVGSKLFFVLFSFQQHHEFYIQEFLFVYKQKNSIFLKSTVTPPPPPSSLLFYPRDK